MSSLENRAEIIVEPVRANQSSSYVGPSLEDRKKLYRESIAANDRYWSSIAKQYFHWEKTWPSDDHVKSYNFHKSKGPIEVKWFEGGVTNVCYNALDRHLEANGNKVCFYAEGNEACHASIFTYSEMYKRVVELANVLKTQFGVKKGDRVVIYLPMIPFAAAVMLACARIGAVATVVFAGFSAQSLTARILDAKATVVVTADASSRGTKPIPLKDIVDEALASCEAEEHKTRCLVFANMNQKHCTMQAGRDVWYSDALEKLTDIQHKQCEIEWMDAEDPLFLLYTSGSTGKPKAIVHTTGGYMVYAATTFRYTFDYHPEDVYMCTADIGWITGHSYVVYGPMLNCATSVLFEGLPTYPNASRWWELVEKYKVSIFYTAPTAIRSLMQHGSAPVDKCDLSSLRILGSVGEPINVEAWKWYHEVVGRGHADIVDTWWQTETGGHMITPLPGCTPQKPGSATLPFFGIQPVILDPATLKPLEGEADGLLAIDAPWPGMARTISGDHDRYEKTYFNVDGFYITGDGAHRDEDGYIWITGRVDDVLNVSGHRIGTSEVEDAVNTHPAVIESAVVGVPHEIKGEGIYVFVTFKDDVVVTKELMTEVKNNVRAIIGPLATPDAIQTANTGLPKTRSGKIVRRVLRKIAAHDVSSLGDLSTLVNPGVVQELVSQQAVWVK